MSEKVIKNTFWNILSFLLSMIISLIAVPILLHNLGKELYGIYILCGTLTGVMQVFNIETATSTVKFITEAIVQDKKTIRLLFGNILTINIGVGLIGMVILIGFSDFLIKDIFSVSERYLTDSEIAFKLIGFGWLLKSIAVPFNNITVVVQNFKIKSIVNQIINIITPLVLITTVLLGYGIVAIIIVTSIILPFLYLLIRIFVAKKLLKEVTCIPTINKNVMKKIWKFSLWTTLSNIGSILYHRADKIIIGSLLGVEVVGIYHAVISLFQRLYKGILTIGEVLFPAFAEINARQVGKDLQELFAPASWFISALGGAVFFSLGYWGEDIVSIWLGKDIAIQARSLFIPLSIGFIVVTTSIVKVNFLLAIGKPQWLTFGSLISGIISIIANVIFIKQYGFNGVGYAFLSTILGGLIWWGKFTDIALFNVNKRTSFLSVYAIPAIVGILLILSHYLVNIGSQFSLIILVFGYCITSILLFFILIKISPIFIDLKSSILINNQIYKAYQLIVLQKKR